MKKDTLTTLTRYGLVLAIGIAANNLLGIAPSQSAPKVEYRVVPMRVPFGERGAIEYQNLLNDMTSRGWKYDHDIPGFVVFRR
jgi:hypothetical protein